MNTKYITLSATCLAVAMTGFAEVSDAKGRNKSKSKHKKEYISQLSSDLSRYGDDHKKGGKGYPNGRPWRALEKDLGKIKKQNRRIERKTNAVLHKVDKVEEDIQDIANDVSALTNTLQIEVSILPVTGDEYTDERLIARMFVQVSQSGIGVTELDSSSFSFSKSFAPKGGTAFYCGQPCFTKAENGLYAIDLKGNDVSGNYAGTLVIEDKNSMAVPTGTSLVTFDIPEPPLVPAPK